MLDYILINLVWFFFLSKIALLVISAMRIFSDKNEVRLSFFIYILVNYHTVPLSFYNNNYYNYNSLLNSIIYFVCAT